MGEPSASPSAFLPESPSIVLFNSTNVTNSDGNGDNIQTMVQENLVASVIILAIVVIIVCFIIPCLYRKIYAQVTAKRQILDFEYWAFSIWIGAKVYDVESISSYRTVISDIHHEFFAALELYTKEQFGRYRHSWQFVNFNKAGKCETVLVWHDLLQVQRTDIGSDQRGHPWQCLFHLTFGTFLLSLATCEPSVAVMSLCRHISNVMQAKKRVTLKHLCAHRSNRVKLRTTPKGNLVIEVVPQESMSGFVTKR